MDLLLAGVDRPAVYVHQEMLLDDMMMWLWEISFDIEKGWQLHTAEVCLHRI